MPPPVDLTGRRFGALLALRCTRANGRPAWVCLCDCGRETTVPTNRLSSVADDNPRAIRACEPCRSRPCAICSTLYLKSGSAATCGAESCRLEYRRAKNRLWAQQQELRQPGYHNDLQRQRIQRMRDHEPEKYAALQESQRESARRRREHLTADDRALRRAWARAYYAENRERIRAQFAAWLDAMPEERRTQWRERAAQAGRDRNRRNALAQMMRDAQQLIDRGDT